MVDVQYRAVRPVLTDGQLEVLQCDNDGSLYVSIADTASAEPIDRSGAIISGGHAQTIMAANANRQGFSIQNLSSAALWFNGLGVAATIGRPNFMLPSGAMYESPVPGTPSNAVSIIGAATGQSFSAREW
jgi:hypothetical protein